MDSARSSPDPSVVAACEVLGFTPVQLWTGYFAVGGLLGHGELVSYLDGGASLSDRDHDMLALVLNEELAERGVDHVVGYYALGDRSDV
jgi:hypothetical protein